MTASRATLLRNVAARSASDPVRGRCRCAGRGRRAARVPRRRVGEPAEPYRRRRVQPTSDRGHVRARRQRAVLLHRTRLLGAGVREHLVPPGAEGRHSGSSTSGSRATRDRGELSPDRPHDRLRRAGSLQGQRLAGVHRRLGELQLGLLPRDPRAGARRGGHQGGARAGRSPPLRRPGRARDGLHRLPVRPRARTRADDPHRPRPAALALDLRTPPDRVGSDLLRRRRLHGELQLLLRRQVALPPRQRPRLSRATPWRRSTSSTATSR